MRKNNLFVVLFVFQFVFVCSVYSRGIPDPYEGMESCGLKKKIQPLEEITNKPTEKSESLVLETKEIKEEKSVQCAAGDEDIDVQSVIDDTSSEDNDNEAVPLLDESVSPVKQAIDVKPEPDKDQKETLKATPDTKDEVQEGEDEDKSLPPVRIDPNVPICPTTELEPENNDPSTLPVADEDEDDESEESESSEEPAALPVADEVLQKEPALEQPKSENEQENQKGASTAQEEKKPEEAPPPVLLEPEEVAPSVEPAMEVKKEENESRAYVLTSVSSSIIIRSAENNPVDDRFGSANQESELPLIERSSCDDGSCDGPPGLYQDEETPSIQTVSESTCAPSCPMPCERQATPCYTPMPSRECYTPYCYDSCPCQEYVDCCDSSCSWRSKCSSMELRLGYFRPDSCRVREIYPGGSLDVEAEYTGALPIDCLRWWVNLNFLSKDGRSIPLHDKTVLHVATTSIGAKYFYNLCGDFDFYIGAGIDLQIIRMHDESPYVITNVSKNGIGLVGKGGITYSLSECFFLDLFIDYYAQGELNFGDNPRVERIPLDIGGLRTGIGMGVAF